MKKKWLICFLVVAVFSFFATYKLGKTIMNVDAQHWYARSQGFISALKKGRLEKTFQDTKPGVTVMWLSGTSLETFLSLYKIKYGFRPQLYTYETFPLVQMAAILPLIFFQILFMVLFYKLVSELFGKQTGIISLILLALHPFYVGNVRFLHVDATLTACMTLSFLYFLKFLKTGGWDLLFSGIFFGLGMLTKTQAIMLVPVLTVLTLINFRGQWSWLKSLKTLAVWLVAGLLVFSILFPAVWVDPVNSFQKIVAEAWNVAEEGNTSRMGFEYYFLNLPRIVSWPIVILFFVGIWQLLKKRDFSLGKVVFYFFVYLLGMSLVTQKIDRYTLPLFPVIAIISGSAVANLGSLLNKSGMVLSTVFVFSLANLIYFTPYYETFGMKNQGQNYYGSLFNEVGSYLNEKKDPEDLNIVVMTKAYSLKPFTRGKVFGHEEEPAKNRVPDYLVTNNYWLEKYGKPKYFEQCAQEKSIYYHNQIFWDIYYCRR